MQINWIKPRKALNPAYLKVKPIRSEIEAFKNNLVRLIDSIDDTKDEEYHKTEVRDFLKNTYYNKKYYFNVKQNIDWAICNGPKSNDSVGVLIETKKHTNKTEMVSKDNINRKALHELILYYLRERITGKNFEIKHIVATNIHEWFIFDAAVFEKVFAQNKKFVKQFSDFQEGRLAGTSTDFFYQEIAQPFVESLFNDPENSENLEFTYFDIRDYNKALKNQNKHDDKKLIVLYKLLSPEHLLKLPFTNDSNTLDRTFYAELLHIIGLAEWKEKNKMAIGRKPKDKRDPGSLIENIIVQLDNLDKISRLPNPEHYGSNYEERLFNAALQLAITWVNRILFLKLLEAQLIAYHLRSEGKTAQSLYAFLNTEKLKNYDDLNSLFFSVLARKQENRLEDLNNAFIHVPYLNSSLFEVADIEAETIVISNLRDEIRLPIHPSTVLKDTKGKRLTGKINALEYLFEFLDAYDFSSEGSEDIQEDNKTLINASVLGLIFEKINGYKDGSFFTPGFITMYMCRETIRRSVVQKFNEENPKKKKNLKTLDDVYDAIRSDFTKQEANTIINSIKICDPAVGSGHFLVSALNEILAIKSELKILMDRTGKTLRDYQVSVVNDELMVRDEDGKLFEYHPGNNESQRVQEALFHEKQIIIEKCLFGVDINPNSVKICRLRLWIELLKHAYYVQKETLETSSPVCYADSVELREGYEIPLVGQLQTLPNIDINIKCGNSLISRFDLDADISKALKKSKWNIDTYRIAVQTYREASNKEQKREMEQLIREIKSNFRTEISRNSKEQKKLDKLGQELFQLTGKGRDGTGLMLFEPEEHYGKDKSLAKKRKEKIKRIEAEIEKLEAKIEDIKSSKIYKNAFEWRFEFPEVLDDKGGFVGFDVVIGNPPYIRQEEFSHIKPYLQSQYETFTGTADLYVCFVEKGLNIAKLGAHFVYILPNKWMRAGYGTQLRKWIKDYEINAIVDFGDLPVFEEATTYPCLWFIQKQSPSTDIFKAATVSTLDVTNRLENHIAENFVDVDQKLLPDTGWTLVDETEQKLLEKIKNAGTPLGEYVQGKIYRGVLTGLNEAFVIDRAIKEKLVQEDPNCEEIIKPFLAGRDIKRYQQSKSDKFLILFQNGQTKAMFGKRNEKEAWVLLKDKYPSIIQHLKPFEEKAKARYDKGEYWWELRACDYYDEFEKPKIVWPETSLDNQFCFVNKGIYLNKTTFFIPSKNEFILGLLNSKLAKFYFDSIVSKMRGGYFSMSKAYVETIKIINHQLASEEITNSVKKIHSLKEQNPFTDISALEEEIDLMVYKLYELTYEEVKIVDREFKLSEKEYKQYKL